MKYQNLFLLFRNRTLLSLSVILFGWLCLAAQTETENEEEEVLVLSVFEVEASQDQGYLSSDAISGLKINKNLLDIPQAIQIVTRDVIEDLGTYGNVFETVKYVVSGVQPLADIDSNTARGFRGSDTFTDGVLERGLSAEHVNIDRVESAQCSLAASPS